MVPGTPGNRCYCGMVFAPSVAWSTKAGTERCASRKQYQGIPAEREALEGCRKRPGCHATPWLRCPDRSGRPLTISGTSRAPSSTFLPLLWPYSSMWYGTTTEDVQRCWYVLWYVVWYGSTLLAHSHTPSPLNPAAWFQAPHSLQESESPFMHACTHARPRGNQPFARRRSTVPPLWARPDSHTL